MAFLEKHEGQLKEGRGLRRWSFLCLVLVVRVAGQSGGSQAVYTNFSLGLSAFDNTHSGPGFPSTHMSSRVGTRSRLNHCDAWRQPLPPRSLWRRLNLWHRPFLGWWLWEIMREITQASPFLQPGDRHRSTRALTPKGSAVYQRRSGDTMLYFVGVFVFSRSV